MDPSRKTDFPSPTPATWSAVDDYFGEKLLAPDPILDSVIEANAAAGLPRIDVTPAQGKFLQILARVRGARRILEIGTLGGYSTVWLARVLPPDGRLITLEIDPRHAGVASANITRAGLSDRVEVRVGDAMETLGALEAEGCDPFEFIFIDADKHRSADYAAIALRLAQPGALIVVDNVVRNGAVADPASEDPAVLGARRLVEWIKGNPRVDATALQTVGAKGYDGFVILRVH